MKQLQISKDIFPLGVFKTKASNILKQLHQSQRPVVITQNGNPSAVLITPETYDSLMEEKKFIQAVGEGLEDSKAGRVVDDEKITTLLDETFGKIEK
jgi:prevent-host-death family protein